ncbi:MAG: type II toxin-antitoxin system VapC family toxin [Spirochaetia bacterium]
MAIDIAIDTNRYRDFVDAVPEAARVFRKASRICVPFIVIAELRAGFAVGRRGKENEGIFEQFLQRERVEILMPTMETTRGYAHLFRQLREAGTPIPTNDIWIAAITIQHDLYLFSRDEHFDFLPQIPRL